MTTTHPSGRRTFVGASAFAMLLAASIDRAAHMPTSWWVSLALLPAALGAAVDTQSTRLPDELMAIAAYLAAWAALATGRPEALLAAGVAGGTVLVLHLINPVWFGFGDVKLAGVLGAIVGLVDWRLGVWTLAGAALVGLLAAVSQRRTSVVFGPALVVAAIGSLIVNAASRGAWT